MRGEEYKSKAEYERAQAEEDYLEYGGRRFSLPVESLPHPFRRTTPPLPLANEMYFESRKVIFRREASKKPPIEIIAKLPEQTEEHLEELREKAI